MTGLGQHGGDGVADAGGGAGHQHGLGVCGEGVDMGKKRGQAIPIAPLRPPTLAAFRPWGIEWELAGDLPSGAKVGQETPGCIFAPIGCVPLCPRTFPVPVEIFPRRSSCTEGWVLPW